MRNVTIVVPVLIASCQVSLKWKSGPDASQTAIKPIATMTDPLPSVDINTGLVVEAPYHRSDICQVPPACVIGEAMMALVLAGAMIEKFGGDHIKETRRNFDSYVASHQDFGRPEAAS